MIQRPAKIFYGVTGGIEEQGIRREAAIGMLGRDGRRSRIGTAARRGIDGKRKEERGERSYQYQTSCDAGEL